VIPSGAPTNIQGGPSGAYVNSMNATHEVGWASFEDDGSECHGGFSLLTGIYDFHFTSHSFKSKTFSP